MEVTPPDRLELGPRHGSGVEQVERRDPDALRHKAVGDQPCGARRRVGRLLPRPFDLLATLDLVLLVDGGLVFLAGTAVDRFLLAVLGLDRVVAGPRAVLV